MSKPVFFKYTGETTPDLVWVVVVAVVGHFLAKFYYFTDQMIIFILILWKGNGFVIMYQMIVAYNHSNID